MSENPCQREKDRALKAAEEWERASEATRRFVVTKPLHPSDALSPKSPEYLEDMRRAFDLEAQTRKRYVEAMNAWNECEKGRS